MAQRICANRLNSSAPGRAASRRGVRGSTERNTRTALALRGIKDVKVGMQLHAQSAQGTHTVTVTKILGDMVIAASQILLTFALLIGYSIDTIVSKSE